MRETPPLFYIRMWNGGENGNCHDNACQSPDAFQFNVRRFCGIITIAKSQAHNPAYNHPFTMDDSIRST